MSQNGQPSPDARPAFETIPTGVELRRWYWRKDELVGFARSVGVKTTGSKFLILDRLAHFLDTGQKTFPGDIPVRPASTFDWHAATLTPETVITDNYKNSQNVRRFFKSQLGDSFKFDIALMDWIKANTGKTLREACDQWHRNQADRKAGRKTQIKDHNQFNQFTRDFLQAHPDCTMDDVRKVWAEKIKRPSDTGRHRYDAADIHFLPSDSR